MCFISTAWKRKQIMEQQPHRTMKKWNQSKNKTRYDTFKLAARSIAQFVPQTIQRYH